MATTHQLAVHRKLWWLGLRTASPTKSASTHDCHHTIKQTTLTWLFKFWMYFNKFCWTYSEHFKKIHNRFCNKMSHHPMIVQRSPLRKSHRRRSPLYDHPSGLCSLKNHQRNLTFEVSLHLNSGIIIFSDSTKKSLDLGDVSYFLRNSKNNSFPNLFFLNLLDLLYYKAILMFVQSAKPPMPGMGLLRLETSLRARRRSSRPHVTILL